MANAAEMQDLVETAMSKRMYSLADSMLAGLPQSVTQTQRFADRYKAFALAKWAEFDGWSTDEPKLLFATLHDYLQEHEPENETPLLVEAAAHYLSTYVTPASLMRTLFQQLDGAFPEGDDDDDQFRAVKKKASPRCFGCSFADSLLQFRDAAKEIDVAFDLVGSLAKNGDQLRQTVLKIASELDASLPTVKLATGEHRQAEEPGPLLLLDGEDEYDGDSFSAAELRAAFPGTWHDWAKLIRQDLPEVQAFLQKRAATHAASRAATPVSAAKKAPAPSPSPAAVSPAARAQPVERKSKSKDASTDTKRKRFWSHQEELDLVRGVRKYGVGAWKSISLDAGFSFDYRSTIDLKDKWRNLAKKLPELERELDERQAAKHKAKKRADAGKKTNKKGRDDDDDNDDDDENDGGDDDEVEEVESSEPAAKAQPPRRKTGRSPAKVREQAVAKRQKRLEGLDGDRQ